MKELSDLEINLLLANRLFSDTEVTLRGTTVYVAQNGVSTEFNALTDIESQRVLAVDLGIQTTPEFDGLWSSTVITIYDSDENPHITNPIGIDDDYGKSVCLAAAMYIVEQQAITIKRLADDQAA